MMDSDKKEADDVKTAYSELLAGLRSYLKLSRAAFAAPLGLSPTHIARFEKADSVPTEATIAMICQVYNVDKRYFEGRMPVESAVVKNNQGEGIPGRLKSARKAKGWTQDELANRSKTSQPVIARVESGTSKLTEKQGVKLANTLKVGVEWLMKGDEGKKDWPADQRMIDWLWEHEDVRREIWEQMEIEKDEG